MSGFAEGVSALKPNSANSRDLQQFAVRAGLRTRPLMHLVTNLGDLAVLLPASLGLIAFLAWIGAKGV